MDGQACAAWGQQDTAVWLVLLDVDQELCSIAGGRYLMTMTVMSFRMKPTCQGGWRQTDSSLMMLLRG